MNSRATNGDAFPRRSTAMASRIVTTKPTRRTARSRKPRVQTLKLLLLAVSQTFNLSSQLTKHDIDKGRTTFFPLFVRNMSKAECGPPAALLSNLSAEKRNYKTLFFICEN